eukprot:Nitzschia sp. Nitz4//scaffold17_size182527//44169//48060//NITZ4_001838-RA/size182527-augustus-gene-0.14-mRNA-1//-1//CDS//3329539292//5373//frame0
MDPSRRLSNGYASHGSEEDDLALGMDFDLSLREKKSDTAENVDLKNETRKTSVIRCLVITTLLTTAAIVANVALIYTLTEEEEAFKDEYIRHSNRVVERFLDAFSEKISAADSFVSQLSFGSASSNITIDAFQQRLEGIRQLSTATTVSFSPVLQGDVERRQWEQFASESYDSDQRKLFTSTYEPHEGKYSFDLNPLVDYRTSSDWTVDSGIFRVDNEAIVEEMSSQLLAPIWQIAPMNTITENAIMFNQLSESSRRQAVEKAIDQRGYVVSDGLYSPATDSLHSTYAAPVILLYYPLFQDISVEDSELLGVITFEIGMEALLEDAVPGYEVHPVSAVVETSCGTQLTFTVAGATISFEGVGDLHESIPDVGTMDTPSSSFQDFVNLMGNQSIAFPTVADVPCAYKVTIYPTNVFYEDFLTNRPVIVEAIVGMVFLFTVAVFIGYDCLVESRQRRVLEAAQKSNALVSSLFPKGVRDRMLKGQGGGGSRPLEVAPRIRLKSFVMSDSNSVEAAIDRKKNTSEPIADLFLQATILFADISGFSAWASEREPSQVFTLLETFFTSFDTIARRLGVFKVETVGDVYVAATGIPEVRQDHAIAMVRFANAILHRANDLAKALESTLGPGTADLTLRIGVHSGPVTAGVLRGEKSRFQLFGDTMNSAARMETTSLRGRIQLSSDTADLIIDAGRGQWVELREDLVEAKGKGKMQTYWLKPEKQGVDTRKSLIAPSPVANMLEGNTEAGSEEKERLIDWNLTVMMSLIEKIMASRGKARRPSRADRLSMSNGLHEHGQRILDEVKEVIPLAEFDCQAVLRSDDYVVVPSIVRSELRDYIAQVCSLYVDNPFHNFSHASHVTMSAHKLIKRITRPDEVNYSHAKKENIVRELHEATYGISSDPLTQLAIVISALVHDAGHTGVPNFQLAKEHPAFVAKYGEKSIAEQRSLDLTLELLQAPVYSNVRECIVPTKEEQSRLRQLIINSVLATDIFDKDLGELRKARWVKAFGAKDASAAADPYVMDRKATIVIEHVIQASDVAHTMQHWKIYKKWNQNLYVEMYKAYKDGRSEKDPTTGWYKGELWFFDNYVIPLTKKLKDCGVFGSSSDEYLHYALENRQEWERQGEQIVKEMHEAMKVLEGGGMRAEMKKAMDVLGQSSRHIRSSLTNEIIEETMEDVIEDEDEDEAMTPWSTSTQAA